MPMKAHKPCRVPSCPNFRVEGSLYCEKHKASEEKLDGKRDYQRRKQLTPSTYKGEYSYGHEWRKIRNAYLKKHPYCEKCGRPAELVHHNIPCSKGGTHDKENLISLSWGCHSRLERKRDG